LNEGPLLLFWLICITLRKHRIGDLGFPPAAYLWSLTAADPPSLGRHSILSSYGGLLSGSGAFMAPAENPFARSIKLKRIPPFRGGIFLY